ncbi:unnamed protein product [Pedinophyceae sp. YPF-701]|nr:unnamed protein product [Pedinophyceae sp. YPF-701]
MMKLFPEQGAGERKAPEPTEEQVDDTADGLMGDILSKLAGGEGKPVDESQGQAIVDGIMRQLLSRDVLLEPLREIGAKYPRWLATNAEKVPRGELDRYRRQHKLIQDICALYEEQERAEQRRRGAAGGSIGDEEEDYFPRLMELFQDMQDCGQPPAEIAKDLGELDGEDPGGGAPGGCPMQ